MSGGDFSREPRDVPHVNTKYRKIITKIPVPESLELFQVLDKYESRSMHGQLPVVWDKAVGFQVFDHYGNCWIDFTSTIFVANSGHANRNVVAAIAEKLNQKLLHTYTFVHKSRVKFIKKLVEMTPPQFEKAFLLSAGTEATECALKLTRMYGQGINDKKKVVISFQGCMHGRTMGAEMLKGDPRSSAWIGYTDPNILHLPIPFPWGAPGRESAQYDWAKQFKKDMDMLKSRGLDFNNIAGFMIESYVGWAAYLYPQQYMKAMADFAKQYKSLLIFDEIQGGFGRTGKLFVYQHYGVEPDMICLGKALSGSLPLSAVIGRQKIMDIPDIGSMSSTHSANPLCCAAGLANLEAIEDGNLVAESARKGKILHARLAEIKAKYPDRLSYVFGVGLIAAVVFREPKTGRPDVEFPTAVCEKAMQKGLLLVHTGRESIKMGPPLTIPDAALLEGLQVFEDSITEIA